MGKKRIVKKSGGEMSPETRGKALSSTSKKKLEAGNLHVHATYNNTKVLLTDKSGNAIIASSSGSLGFTGAKKGTPFAAAKVGELIGDKAVTLGVKEVD